MELTPLCSLRRQAPAVSDYYVAIVGNRRKTKKQRSLQRPAHTASELEEYVHREASVLGGYNAKPSKPLHNGTVTDLPVTAHLEYKKHEGCPFVHRQSILPSLKSTP
ncbi:hypothetical protein PGTUg99_008688 [Puccinia graminis f. sp. tritici]|uniref:Uncharacterized protein n=1 Tax=Puccinia graminis f. sp. tritici TaxID=56615 RepID=A0A5B0RUF1_PUCGR|nr:hypothetical protein PGTUg99_008688 [Puccinia graminis f. sp. tritici]